MLGPGRGFSASLSVSDSLGLSSQSLEELAISSAIFLPATHECEMASNLIGQFRLAHYASRTT